MKVYILFNPTPYSENGDILGVFLNKKNAENMYDKNEQSVEHEDSYIEEHEVIE